MLPGPGGLSLALLQRRAVQLIRGAPHGDLPQGGQVLHGTKVLESLLCLALPVHLSRLKAFHQLVRLDIHQLDLIGPVKDVIRDALIDRDACDGGHQIVQRLQMLHIDRGVDVDAGLEQLFHILIALRVPATLGVAVGQFIDQDELRFPL